MVGLYFHVPFCSRKCDYCHFYVLPNQSEFHTQYMEGLRLEWEMRRPLLQDKTISTIYFGGGTPSLLGPDAIGEILEWIDHDASEVTLEVNPEHVTKELIEAYRAAGINRISLGLQALDDALLQNLTRQHSAKEAIDAVHTTHTAGIHNISVDLMLDLPHQTPLHVQSTLDQVSALPITHLSLYNLTIEPHTPFFKHRDKLSLVVPKEDASLLMLDQTVTRLEKEGLQRYEISAFARPGFEADHNTGYWTGRPFLGFGPSAYSYWEKKRFRNVAHLGKYCRVLKGGDEPVDYTEQLEPEAALREHLAIRLRLVQGVDLEGLQKEWGPLTPDLSDSINTLSDEGFLKLKDDQVQLTPKGRLFYDTVAAEIV